MVTSYNGYTASADPRAFGGLEPLVVAGEPFSPGVRAGAVRIVLEYVAEQLNARVEPVVRADWHQADDWGYSYRPNRNNPSALSCHASGTAIDYNATRHPNGRRGTFTTAQRAEVLAILAEVDDVVGWGGAWGPTSVPDEMHYEIDAPLAKVTAVAARILANGGPERRLGAAPAAPTTNDATGTGASYRAAPGNRGPKVWHLQAWLNDTFPGYADTPLRQDGIYGDRLASAVREFQRRSGIGNDGTVGPVTAGKLAALGFVG